jgi:hypothetical protein
MQTSLPDLRETCGEGTPIVQKGLSGFAFSLLKDYSLNS